jgi:flagellar biosynthesis protein FlhG
MGLFIDELLRFATRYDVLVLDCAAGIGNSVTAFLAAAPLSLIVTTTQPTSIMDVYALIKVIRQENLGGEIALVPNMIGDAAQAQKALQRLVTAAKTYLATRLEVLAPIPFSDAVPRAVYARRPLLVAEPEDAAARQVSLLARGILQKRKASTVLENLDIRGLLDGMLKG